MAAVFNRGPQVRRSRGVRRVHRGRARHRGVEWTDALDLAYRAVGVAPGDEVIIPANTFIATAEAVVTHRRRPGARRRRPRHLLIDPTAVEAAISRTPADRPVHLYRPDRADRADHADRRRHGSRSSRTPPSRRARSRHAAPGALGRVAATSFYPGKNLGAAGDAGALMTDDPEIAALVRNVAAHGSSIKYVHDRIGMNARLDAVQATVLRAKLRRLDAWNDARRAAAERYSELLADVPEVRTPSARPGNDDVWHLYVVRVDERDGSGREWMRPASVSPSTTRRRST